MDESVGRCRGRHRRVYGSVKRWRRHLRRRHRAVYQGRRAVANVSQWRRSYTLQSGTLRLRWVNRGRRGEPLVGGRSGEFLDHIPEIILVDIIHRWLMLLRLLIVRLRLRLRLRLRMRMRLRSNIGIRIVNKVVIINRR